MFDVQTTEEDTRRGEAEQLEGLLLLTGRGDREAFGLLYEQTRTAVYAVALSLLHDAHEAQDTAQDVYVKVWDSAAGYRAQGAPMAWLLTITRNFALSRLRRSGRTLALDDEAWNAIPAPAPNVTSEDRQVLQQALGALGAEERRIVLLHAAAGLKHREIAALLELPLSTVLSKYHRGLNKLRRLMEGESDQ